MTKSKALKIIKNLLDSNEDMETFVLFKFYDKYKYDLDEIKSRSEKSNQNFFISDEKYITYHFILSDLYKLVQEQDNLDIKILDGRNCILDENSELKNMTIEDTVRQCLKNLSFFKSQIPIPVEVASSKELFKNYSQK